MSSSGVRPGLPKNSVISRPMLVLTSARPIVPNRGVSGSAINSTMLLRMAMYLPLGSFHSIAAVGSGSGKAVIGRAWTMANSPSASVHSISIGIPIKASIRMPRRTSLAANSSVRTGTRRRGLGTGCS